MRTPVLFATFVLSLLAAPAGAETLTLAEKKQVRRIRRLRESIAGQRKQLASRQAALESTLMTQLRDARSALAAHEASMGELVRALAQAPEPRADRIRFAVGELASARGDAGTIRHWLALRQHHKANKSAIDDAVRITRLRYRLIPGAPNTGAIDWYIEVLEARLARLRDPAVAAADEARQRERLKRALATLRDDPDRGRMINRVRWLEGQVRIHPVNGLVRRALYQRKLAETLAELMTVLRQVRAGLGRVQPPHLVRVQVEPEGGGPAVYDAAWRDAGIAWSAREEARLEARLRASQATVDAWQARLAGHEKALAEVERRIEARTRRSGGSSGRRSGICSCV